jgi:WD40 repeat protein
VVRCGRVPKTARRKSKGTFFPTNIAKIEKIQLRVYDSNAGSFNKLQPIMTYEEHDNIITSLTNHSLIEGLFFSGSVDQTIKLWDAK